MSFSILSKVKFFLSRTGDIDLMKLLQENYDSDVIESRVAFFIPFSNL